MESLCHSHSSQTSARLSHESCLQEILGAREAWKKWIWRGIRSPTRVRLRGLPHSSSFLSASFLLAWTARCLLQPFLRPQQSRDFPADTGVTGQCKWTNRVTCFKQSFSHLYLYLSCKQVWNRLHHMPPCGMSIPFPPRKYSMTLDHNAAHRGRCVKGPF